MFVYHVVDAAVTNTAQLYIHGAAVYLCAYLAALGSLHACSSSQRHTDCLVCRQGTNVCSVSAAESS